MFKTDCRGWRLAQIWHWWAQRNGSRGWGEALGWEHELECGTEVPKSPIHLPHGWEAFKNTDFKPYPETTKSESLEVGISECDFRMMSHSKSKTSLGTSLVAQWIRLRSQCRGLVREQDPTCMLQLRVCMLQLRSWEPQLRSPPATTKTQCSQINKYLQNK